MTSRDQLTASLRPLVSRCWQGHCWVKTANGPRRIDEEFTEVHLSEHVMGVKAYGLCPIAPGSSTTRAACLDLDSHKGATPWPEMLRTAEMLIVSLELDGYMPMAFKSSGGQGIHIYLIWDKDQDAYSVREMLRSTLAGCGLSSGTKGVAKGEVEVFPKQDEVPSDGFGNMFILPLAGNSQSSPITAPFAWRASDAVPVLERPERVATSDKSTADIARLKSALDAVPNSGEEELDYDNWRNVIFALHYATDGDASGLVLAHEFSARSSKYDPDFLDNRVWPYIRSDRGGDIVTDRSLFALAEKAGWDDPELLDDFDVVDIVRADTEQGDPASGSAPARFAPIPAHLFAQGSPPRWLVKGVLPQAEIVVVYGASGSGKSFWVTDMVAAIGRGVPWRGLRVTQGEVCYIVAEGSGGFRPRLNAYASHHSVALEDIGMHIIAAAPNFTAKEDIVELVNAIRPIKPAVVVVDTLSRVLAGADENSGEDMGRVVKHCETIHRVTGAVVILIHHSGKDEARGARGWSGLRAAADAEIEIVRSEHDRVARVTKQKDGDDMGQEFGFRLGVVQLGMDADGDPVTSCVVEHAEGGGQATRERVKVGTNEGILMGRLTELADLTGEAVSVTELIDASVAQVPFDTGTGKRDKRRENMLRALQSLQGKGLVRVDGGKVEQAGGV